MAQFLDATRPHRDRVIDPADADGGICVDGRTLVTIDMAGADDRVIPALAPVLTERKPFVHVAFPPWDPALGDDPYVTAVTRLHVALAIAAALARYRFMYVFWRGGWIGVDPPARLSALRRALLAPDPVPGGAGLRYGLIGSVGFSDTALVALGA